MPVYDAAAGLLMRDIFHGEENLPASDAVTVQIWDGDPDAAGSLLTEERVPLPWLITVLTDPYQSRGDNPAVISMGPAPGGGWNVTHVRVLCGPVGTEVPLWVESIAGGTLAVTVGYYVNIPASVLASIIAWPPGSSGTGDVPHVKASAVIMDHALGGTNEVRGTGGFIMELWDHDPLHVGHGTPLTTITLNRDSGDWTYTAGPPAEMENANAIVSAAAPGGGWDWQYTTLRISGGTAFLFKTGDFGVPVAAAATATIAAGAIVFSLTPG